MSMEQAQAIDQVADQAATSAPEEAVVSIDPQKLHRYMERLRDDQSLMMGITGGFLGAAIGAVLWAMVTVLTKYQIGYMALGADDYASFIPGILFVVVLLLAFVAAMNGPFQFFVVDIAHRAEAGYFDEGALYWKFLRDGLLIAFYPVFGEVIFFYLQAQRLKKEQQAEEDAEIEASRSSRG